MITLDEAKELQYGDILIDNNGRRWKVNGKVQRWKKNPDRIRVPLKHGLYVYDSISEHGDLALLTKEAQWLESMTKSSTK